MTGLRCALAVLAVVCSGLGIVEWAFGDGSCGRIERGLRIVVGTGVGLGVWSCSYVMLLFAFRADSTTIALKDIALTLVGSGLFGYAARGRTRVPSALPPVDPRWMVRVLVVLFLVAIAVAPGVFALRIARTPDGFWDAWAIWNLRARFFVRTAGNLGTSLSPELGWNTHPDYPLMLPGLIAQWWLLATQESLNVPPVIAGVFAILIAGTLTLSVVQLRGPVSGLMAGLVLLGTSAFLRMASQQVADVPVATFGLMAIAVAALAIEQPGEHAARRFALAGLMASMAMWTKNEGGLHAIALLTAVVLAQPRDQPLSKRVQEVVWIAVGAVPLVVLLVYFKLTYAPANDLIKDTTLVDLLRRATVFERYQAIFGALWERVCRVNDWNAFLIMLPLLWLAFARRRPMRPAARMAAATTAMVLLGFMTVYLLTPRDLPWHIRTSIDRVLMQWWPSFVLATFLALPSVTRGRQPLARAGLPH